MTSPRTVPSGRDARREVERELTPDPPPPVGGPLAAHPGLRVEP